MIQRRLLQQADTEPGLAGAGHADDHGMGGEVLRVIQHQLVREGVGGCVVALAEVEAAQFLEVRQSHGVSSGVGVTGLYAER